MSWRDEGIVQVTRRQVGQDLRLRLVFRTDESSYRAVLNLPEPLAAVIERVSSVLRGSSTSYELRLYDGYDSDVLAGCCAAIADGSATETIIAAELGGDRRAAVRTMGAHTFYLAAGASTHGVVEVFCRR